MEHTIKHGGGFKARIRHELVEYAINVAFLALVFAAFTEYRRLILSSYDITYENYWFALVKALVLGKVIMIGSIVRLGRGLEDKPIVVPALYKTVVFCVFLAIFTIVEYTAVELWKGGGATAGLLALADKGNHELTANTLVVFVALFPYFAFMELGRIFGQDRVREIFFRKRLDLVSQPKALP